MRKFVLKIVTRDFNLSTLVGETLEFEVVDGDGQRRRLGVEGAWELPADEARSFVGDEVTQQVAKVHAIPDGRGFAIASSQEGERTPGLKATPVGREDADRLRRIVASEASKPLHQVGDSPAAVDERDEAQG